MPDDTPDMPLDGRPENHTGANNSASAELDSQARRWLQAQVDRLGRDPDIVLLLPRKEVEASVRARDLTALTSQTRDRIGSSRPSTRTPSSSADNRASRSARDRQSTTRWAPMWRTAAGAAVLVLLIVGIWSIGHFTQPATQPLASLAPLQDELALVAASPDLEVKSLTPRGTEDLRRGVRALRAAAPHPLSPVPRSDAARAREAAAALDAAYQAFSPQPPNTPVPPALFTVPGLALDAPRDLPDALDTTGDLAAFAALLAAKAHLMLGDAETARQWLGRIEDVSPWYDLAWKLDEQIDALNRPN
ncbi:hypothetical protein BSZ35_18625 [Salinibacter sp. 10B]|uniref:hypothetical protein n=1 Tax=Salinibacter sp. 10B TaxID=1923971 RepID=UPI000CF395A4|nr:hypothetical protein [Salinibacter sp. 10B]PQJ26940.1 hypothetical protein BSZ35_18625 [Salinibacter sp. 10B]